LIELAREIGIKIISAKRGVLERLGPHNQGLALMVKPKQEPGLDELLESIPRSEPALIVFLDHLEDPGNFGALIRSAAAFGALGLVYPKDRSAPVNRAARSASAGASEVIPLVKVVNPVRALQEMKKHGFWVVAAEAEAGEEALSFDFPERSVLVLGSEGSGLSQSLTAQADMLVHIALESPLIDSLNVSNAGAILMHSYRASQAGKPR
jgi:23S rRNA (guanosine2251-2'-O)-methyltransferase